MANTVVNVNFVTGIKKIFPSLLKNVFLVLNVNGDLSLYRQENEIEDNEVDHIWSIGRFKGLVEVHWAPDCKLLAVQCLKRCFIYNSENGKSLSDLAIENENENNTIESSLVSSTICRWLTINEEGKTLLLLGLINCKTFSIKWSVNGEFELSGKFILKSDQIILDVKIDQVTNEILVLQSANNNFCSLTRLKFPFNNSKTTIHDSSNSISSLSKLSRHLQTLFRVTEDLKEQFLKLIKLEDSIFKRISEINSSLIKKLLLFGSAGRTLNQHFDGFYNKENGDKLSENEFLEWKAKLKKHHNELLLQIQEFSNVIQTFHSNFPSFSPSTIDRFIKIFIPNLEQHSQTIQNTLAEFLIWLEIIVIESNDNNPVGTNDSTTPSSVNKIISPLTPDSSALELVKTLNKSEDIKQEKVQEWKFPFVEFKMKLDQEFKDLVNEINSINLVSESETLLPSDLNLILASSHLFNFAFILKTCKTEIIRTSHPDLRIKLPGVYLGHFEQSNQLRIICTGNAQLILTLVTEEFGDGELRPIFNNQIDDSLLLFSNSSLNQLYTTSTGTKLSITIPL